MFLKVMTANLKISHQSTFLVCSPFAVYWFHKQESFKDFWHYWTWIKGKGEMDLICFGNRHIHWRWKWYGLILLSETLEEHIDPNYNRKELDFIELEIFQNKVKIVLQAMILISSLISFHAAAQLLIYELSVFLMVQVTCSMNNYWFHISLIKLHCDKLLMTVIIEKQDCLLSQTVVDIAALILIYDVLFIHVENECCYEWH